MAQATTAAVEAEAKSLAATDPTKYRGADGKPNQAAKDAAKATVDEKGLNLAQIVGALGGLSYAEVEKFAAEELVRVEADIKDIGTADTKEKRKQLAILEGEKAQLQTTKGLSNKTPEEQAAVIKGLETEVRTQEAAKAADAKAADAAAKPQAPVPVAVTVNMDKGFQKAIEDQSVTLEQMKDALCGIQTNLANVFA